MQGLDQGELELKFSDVLGDLELGKLTEEYYLDQDLRDIFRETVLDPDKMAPLEGHHLLLVTSVVYSAKFVLKGNRMHQVCTGRSRFLKTPSNSNKNSFPFLIQTLQFYPRFLKRQENSPSPGGAHFLVMGYQGCAPGCAPDWTDYIAIMDSPFQ